MRQNPEDSDSSLLHIHAFHGDTAKLTSKYTLHPELIKQKDKLGYTPAHYAAQECHFDTFKFIIKSDPHVLYETGVNGSTPAHVAAMSGCIEILKFILSQAKDLANKTNILRKSPFHIAVENAQKEILIFLIEKYPEFIEDNEKLQQELFLTAVKSGHLEILKTIIGYYIILTEKMPKLVFEAVYNGHIDILQYFINAYPNLINSENSDGMTLAHAAAEKGNLAIFKYLISINPKLLTMRDRQRETTAHYACNDRHCINKIGKLEIIEFILQKAPEIFPQKNNYDYTAINTLAYNRWYDSIDVVKRYLPKLTVEQIYSRKDFSESIQCEKCNKIIDYKMYSGMSNAYPHFYCNKCSNIYILESYRYKLYGKKDDKRLAEILEEIKAILPACECGGHFQPGANPKCPYCNFELTHQDNEIQRLQDPCAIVIRGFKMYYG